MANIGDLVKKGKKWAKTAMDRAAALKPFMNANAATGGSTEPGAPGRIVTLNDMWDAEKKRRQLAEQKHVQELNKKGGNFPAGGSGRMGGISFTGAGGRPFSVDKDLLGPGSHGVLVRDLSAARMREASERAAFKALRAEERRMAQKESEAKADWIYHNGPAIALQRARNRSTYLQQQKELYLLNQQNAKEAADFAAMKAKDRAAAPRPKAGPGSVSDGKASLAERQAAAGLDPETGKPMPMAVGAPGVKVGRSGTNVNQATGRATGSAEEGSDPGLAIVHGGPRSKVVGEITEKQMRQSITTGGYNQAAQQQENNRLKYEQEKARDAEINQLLEELNGTKAAYKGGKARRRARLQVLSRR